MVAPAISSIATELNITNEVEQQMVLSVFILAYAVGPLFLVSTILKLTEYVAVEWTQNQTLSIYSHLIYFVC